MSKGFSIFESLAELNKAGTTSMRALSSIILPQWLWFMAEEKTGDCNARIEGATPDRDGSSGRDVMLEQRRP